MTFQIIYSRIKVCKIGACSSDCFHTTNGSCNQGGSRTCKNRGFKVSISNNFIIIGYICPKPALNLGIEGAGSSYCCRDDICTALLIRNSIGRAINPESDFIGRIVGPSYRHPATCNSGCGKSNGRRGNNRVQHSDFVNANVGISVIGGCCKF